MGLVVAILLTLALLGSVLWVMPTPREKRLTQLRNQALRAGLRVRLLDQKMANKLFPWLPDHRGYVLYEKQRRDQHVAAGHRVWVLPLKNDASVHELDRDPEQEAYVKHFNLEAVMPGCAEALVFYPASVALLWRESIEGSVEDIDRALQECLDHPFQEWSIKSRQ